MAFDSCGIFPSEGIRKDRGHGFTPEFRIEHAKVSGWITYNILRKANKKKDKPKTNRKLVGSVLNEYDNCYHSAIKTVQNKAIKEKANTAKNLNLKNNPYTKKLKNRFKEELWNNQLVVGVREFLTRKENIKFGWTDKITWGVMIATK